MAFRSRLALVLGLAVASGPACLQDTTTDATPALANPCTANPAAGMAPLMYELFGATGADCRHEATYPVGTRTATICVTDVDCPSWPLCDDAARGRLHPYQCMSYTVTATP